MAVKAFSAGTDGRTLAIAGGSTFGEGVTTSGAVAIGTGSSGFSVTDKPDSVDSFEADGMASTTAGVSGSVDGGSLSTSAVAEGSDP